MIQLKRSIVTKTNFTMFEQVRKRKNIEQYTIADL